MPSRRDVLKSLAATHAAWLFPHRLFASTRAPRFHFIDTDTLTSWPVASPVSWVSRNRSQPILERAAEGLANLTPDDGERIIRLVARRCGLNLLELRPDEVTVHHWGRRLADLRPFFKTHGLARPEIAVHLKDRKRETTTTRTGDSFLFGSRIAENFPLDLFARKWANRFEKEPDDTRAVPETSSGYAWEGVEDDRIPWTALKSAWRRVTPRTCLNCDTPTLLTHFGQPWAGMFHRAPRFLSLCPSCRRSFREDSVTDVKAWMTANLDEDVQPEYEMVWNRRTKKNTTI